MQKSKRGKKLGNLSKWLKERGYPSRTNNTSLVQLQQFPQNRVLQVRGLLPQLGV